MKSGFTGGRCNVQGLFNLMKDIGLEHACAICTADIKRATRNSYSQHEQHFILVESDVPVVQQLYKRAQGLPGRYGITNLRYLANENQDYFRYESLLRAIIRGSKDTWSREEAEKFGMSSKTGITHW